MGDHKSAISRVANHLFISEKDVEKNDTCSGDLRRSVGIDLHFRK